MRVCPAGNGKGACACGTPSGFEHPASAIAPSGHTGGMVERTPPFRMGASMDNINKCVVCWSGSPGVGVDAEGAIS